MPVGPTGDACATAALLEKRANADILEIVKAEWDVGTSKKAFQINFDAKRYGTFAEIGAGQEVARRFFHVGGASGTIAKTMSAYDMTFSDAIYGPTDRYVSPFFLSAPFDVNRLDAGIGSKLGTFAARSLPRA